MTRVRSSAGLDPINEQRVSANPGEVAALMSQLGERQCPTSAHMTVLSGRTQQQGSLGWRGPIFACQQDPRDMCRHITLPTELAGSIGADAARGVGRPRAPAPPAGSSAACRCCLSSCLSAQPCTQSFFCRWHAQTYARGCVQMLAVFSEGSWAGAESRMTCCRAAGAGEQQQQQAQLMALVAGAVRAASATPPPMAHTPPLPPHTPPVPTGTPGPPAGPAMQAGPQASL